VPGSEIVLSLIPYAMVWGAYSENKKYAVTTIVVMLISQFAVVAVMGRTTTGVLIACLTVWVEAVLVICIPEGIASIKRKLGPKPGPKTQEEIIEERKQNYHGSKKNT